MTRAGFIAFGATCLALGACSREYRVERLPGTAHIDGPRVVAALADEAAARCKVGLEPYVHCETEPALCRADPETHTEIDPAVCSDMMPLLTFVHASDAELTEDRVSLDGPPHHVAPDPLTLTVRRNPDLAQNGFAVLLATMLSVNSLVEAGGTHAPAAYGSCPKPLSPSFVLHTGDAVGTGMLTELSEFLSVVRELRIPFFDAVGNHDVLPFGAFPAGVLQGIDAALPFSPLAGTDEFLRAHALNAALDGVTVRRDPTVDHTGTVHDHPLPPAPGTSPAPYYGSDHFGFDLYCPETELRPSETPSFPVAPPGLCADARGYYGEDFLLPKVSGKTQRKVRLVVLNTAEIGPATLRDAIRDGAPGAMRDEQYLWLARELESHRDTDTLFLVAGHHPLDGFSHDQDGRLRKLLVGQPRVAAYLSGHTHVDAIHSYERPGGVALREITAGSTLVYPELAHLVDLMARPNGETYLRVRTFRQRVSDVFCSSECNLKYLAARARTGAYGDVADPARRLERLAKVAGNGLFRVAGFGTSLPLPSPE